MTEANFTSWYRQDEGVFYVNGDSYGNAGSQTFISADDGTRNNRIQLRFNGVSAISSVIANGDVIVGTGTTQAGSFPGYGKAAVAYSASASAVYANNGVPVAMSALVVPTVNQLVIGSSVSTGPLNGHVRSISYYPKRLTNSELQALTA
jgi:hypothetical protein